MYPLRRLCPHLRGDAGHGHPELCLPGQRGPGDARLRPQALRDQVRQLRPVRRGLPHRRHHHQERGGQGLGSSHGFPAPGGLSDRPRCPGGRGRGLRNEERRERPPQAGLRPEDHGRGRGLRYQRGRGPHRDGGDGGVSGAGGEGRPLPHVHLLLPRLDQVPGEREAPVSEKHLLLQVPHGDVRGPAPEGVPGRGRKGRQDHLSHRRHALHRQEDGGCPP